MKNIQNLTIDINKKPFQTITANVGEVASRFIRITILENNIPADLTGVTAYLYVKKADGTKVFNSVTVENAKQGIVLAELTSQVLSVPGLARLTLLLTKDGAKLASKQIIVTVDESSIDEEAMQSTNEFNALTDALKKVNNIDNKLDKNSILTMANMGQDIKEAMTGGSVAVVGKNAILTENIVDNQVTWGKRTPIGSTFYLSPGTGGFPNYDTTTKTLTIYRDTLIYYGKSYWITEEEIIIDFSTTENFTLWFDAENKTFEPLYFRSNPSNVENKIRVCTCKTGTYPYLTSCPFTFKIDGELPWVREDKINDIINSYPSNGCFLYSGKAGDEFGMIKIDSINMTLTVPKGGSADAGFIINGKYYGISTYNTDVVFSLKKDFTTSLGLILFEFSSKNITVIPYNNPYDKSQYYMLGVIRYSNPLTVNLCVPYMLDGKPYGITTFTTNDDIITEVEKGKNATAEINIACGSGHTLMEQLPIFDSENLTLTLPRGGQSPTGWFINGDYKANTTFNTPVVLNLTKTISSSLGKILIKPSTVTETVLEYQIINWNQTYDYSTWVMIGSIRYAGVPGLSLFCPFIQNGKLYGIDYITSEDVGGLLYQNNKDSIVKSINHRGYCTVAPENTLSAYKLSKKKGYSYVECDVRFTSDGVPVLLHDETIDRTSNGTGNISDMTFEEVRALDFGSWKSSDYEGEQIPTLQEFLMLCKKLDFHPYIELKARYNGSYEIIYNTIKKMGFAKNCTILGGGAETVTALPYARLGVVTSSTSSAQIAQAISYLNGTNEVFIDYQNAKVTEADKALCEEALMAGVQLEVWNVFTKDDVLTNVELGVTGITNDSLNIAKLMQE